MWLNENREIVGYQILKYTYFKPYIPVGLMLDFKLSKYFTLGINYEYQWTIDTYVKIDTLVGAKWFLQRDNDHLLEFPLTYHIRDWLSAIIMPYFRKVAMGGSTAVTTSGLVLGLQPQNYTMWGVEIDLAYTF